MEQVVDLAVRARRVEQGAVARERRGRFLERGVRRLGVQAPAAPAAGDARGRRRGGCCARACRRGRALLPGIHGLPAELGEELDGRTLDELVLGEALRDSRCRLFGARRGRAPTRRSRPVTSLGEAASRSRARVRSSAQLSRSRSAHWLARTQTSGTARRTIVAAVPARRYGDRARRSSASRECHGRHRRRAECSVLVVRCRPVLEREAQSNCIDAARGVARIVAITRASSVDGIVAS